MDNDYVRRTTLSETEAHPSTEGAMAYISSIPFTTLCSIREAFSSCAIEGNRLGEICGETLRRILSKEPVSDRYLLGLAWAIKGIMTLEEMNKAVLRRHVEQQKVFLAPELPKKPFSARKKKSSKKGALGIILEEGILDRKLPPICLVCAEKLANGMDHPHLFWMANRLQQLPAGTVCGTCGVKLGNPSNEKAAERIIHRIS